MIRVRHNDVEQFLDAAHYRSVGEAVAACLGGDEGRPNLLQRVRVNGMAVPENALDALDALPLETVTELELESRSPRTVALASLDSAAEYLPRVRAAIDRTARLLRAGRIDEANRLYSDVLDAVGVLLFSLRAAALELGEAGDPLRLVESESQAAISLLLEAQQQRDWIRVADWLQYELACQLESWEKRIGDVKQRAEARSKR